jgi:hypothetical protein
MMMCASFSGILLHFAYLEAMKFSNSGAEKHFIVFIPEIRRRGADTVLIAKHVWYEIQ